MQDIIHEDVINLDVDKINFDDKEAMKELIIQLLSTIEQLAQAPGTPQRKSTAKG